MTEEDYILAQDLTRLRIAVDVLHQVIVFDDVEMRDIRNQLLNKIEILYEKLKLKEVPK